jgi:hypothetical protein
MAKNNDIHPNAPAFGAGPGAFRSAAPLGMNPDMDKWMRPGPLGIEPSTNFKKKSMPMFWHGKDNDFRFR